MAKELDKKLLLFALKYSPIVLGIGYFILIIFSCFGLTPVPLVILFGQSVLAIIVIILFSLSLGYCFWHRLPLYYILSGNLLNAIDFYIGISVSTKWILIIYLLLVGILVLIGCIMKNKQHVKERNLKEKSISDSRKPW